MLLEAARFNDQSDYEQACDLIACVGMFPEERMLVYLLPIQCRGFIELPEKIQIEVSSLNQLWQAAKQPCIWEALHSLAVQGGN